MKKNFNAGTLWKPVVLGTGVAAMAVFAAFLMVEPARGLAGFEWRPPAPAPAAATAVEAPQDVIRWNDDDTFMPTQKVESVEAVAPAPAPVPLAAVVSTPADVLSGFGADIPLAVALRQIVPAEHRFSFAPEVDPGLIVSWNGEKPWQQVLTDMLAVHGLGFKIQNGVVIVHPATSGEQMPSPPSPDRAESTIPPPVTTVTHADAIPADMMPIAIAPPAPVTAADSSSPAKTVDAVATELPLSVVASVTDATVTSAGESVSEPLPEPVWRAVKGETLRTVLHDWATQAGVEFYWTIDYDYRLNEDVAYRGAFDEVVGKLFDRFTDVRPQPYGRLHQIAGNSGVLIINSYDLVN